MAILMWLIMLALCMCVFGMCVVAPDRPWLTATVALITAVVSIISVLRAAKKNQGER